MAPINAQDRSEIPFILRPFLLLYSLLSAFSSVHLHASICKEIVTLDFSAFTSTLRQLDFACHSLIFSSVVLLVNRHVFINTYVVVTRPLL